MVARDLTDRFNGVQSSLAIKSPCVAVAIANITLSGEQTVNGVAVVEGDRVLVTAQASSIDNGIYDVETSAWTRSADWDGNRDVVNGTLLAVATATVGRNPLYQAITTADPFVVGGSSVTFALADGPNVSYALTLAEDAIGLTDSDIDDSYPELFVNRYGTNTTPGTTSMSTAWNNAALVADELGGGTIEANHGEVYLSDSQITVDFTQTGDYSNIVVSGNGAILKTSGAIAALKLTGGGTLGGITVQNTKVDQRANAAALGGFLCEELQHGHIRDCQFKAGGGTAATYYCVKLTQSDLANGNTGSFWCEISGCQFRLLTGGDAKYQYGVLLEGSANATKILHNGFHGAEEAVRMLYNGASTNIPNSLLIDGNAFEGNVICIRNVGVTTLGGVGPFIVNNRFEANTHAYNESGYDTAASQPVYIGQNFWITGGGAITNTSTSRPIAIDLDLVTPDLNVDNLKRSKAGWTYWSNEAPVHKLRATGGGANVTEWWDNSGAAVRAAMHYVSGSIYKLYATLINNGLMLSGIRSISGGTAREGNNLSGSVVLSSGTAAVSFGTNEPDANYRICLSGDAAEIFTWASKAVGGFTINSDNGSSTANVDWFIVGH